MKNLSPSEATDYSLWKATRKVNNTELPNPPIRKDDGSWAKSNEEKANVFADHLYEVFQPNPTDIINSIDDDVQAFLDSPYQLEPPLQKFTVKQVADIIETKLNPKKSPGHDLITVKILKELPEVGLKYITQIYNAILLTSHFPLLWKLGQIILIQKPGKPPDSVSSYRPISLLPILAKVLEKLLLSRIEPILTNRHVIPNHQFGFRPQHATTEQTHRVCKYIYQSMEDKKYCAAVFLDITQAFDKVWHSGLLYKIRKILPHNYFAILKSYLQDRHYLVRYKDATTNIHPISAGVPQGSVLGPVLYLIFTADLPTSKDVITATYADDTAVLTAHHNSTFASQHLQVNLDKIQMWLAKWRMRINETKSQQITFTNRRGACPPITLNGHQLHQQDVVKYLGMHLDSRLTWKNHIFAKRKQLGIKLSKLQWIIGRRSKLSLDNKILIYKAILKPIWCFGIQLWGTAANSNIDILERFQSKVLRLITNAPWFVTNRSIAHDLQIAPIKEEIKKFTQRYDIRLGTHPNSLTKTLMVEPARRRLKKYIPHDLLSRF